MRKKLAGIHLLAPLNESDVTDLSRNLDRELIINTTPVTDAVIDTYEKTNYIVTFEYDTTLDGGTNRIRRSIPTLELLGNTDANISGTHWINLEDKEYHYIDDGATAQRAFEQLDEQLTKVCYLKHILDAEGIGALVSSDNGTTPSSTVDDSSYAIVLGKLHTLNNANYSALFGGDTSELIGVTYSTIINGYNQRINGSGGNVAIYGGSTNTITGTTIVSDVIINGFANTMDGAVIESIIIGGHNNYIYKNLKPSYGATIIGSVYGYIDDGEFASIYNSANSYIHNGRYTGIELSSYIEIGDSTNATMTTAINTSIASSSLVNIIASSHTTKQLSIYNSTLASIEYSTNSYIWNTSGAIITSSQNSSIGYYIVSDGLNSISKGTSRLEVSDLTNFEIGKLVLLTGAEFTSYTTEYRIYDIDVPNKFLYFVDENDITVSFNTGNTDAINIKPLNYGSVAEATILSNTNDTVVCNVNVNTGTYIAYSVIGNLVNRYTLVSVSGAESTNTIKLKLYGTNDIITNLTPNALTGLIIRQYNEGNSVTTAAIIGSVNAKTWNTGASSLISATNGIIYNGGNGSLIATYDSTITNFSRSAIIGGSDNYIANSSSSIILAGIRNKILENSDGVIISGYDNYISHTSNCAIILGTDNYIHSADNIAIIACNGYTAEYRSNALITNSLTLFDRTLELTNDTPHAGDVLLVDYVASGNIAKVKWGKSTESSGIPGVIETYTSILWGISSMSSDYIQVEPEGSSPTTNYSGQTVGLTVDGYIFKDYLTSSYSTIRSYVDTGTCIDIENGYTYIIKLQTIEAEWLGTCLNPTTPDLSMSCADTFVVVADATPSNDYTLHYKRESQGYATNALVSNQSGYEYMALSNIVSYSEITGSNINGVSGAYTPFMDAKFSRITGTDTSGKLAFYATNIAQTPSYATGINALYNNPGSGIMIIEWPIELDMPTSTSDFIWCKNYLSNNTWNQLYVSQILSGRQVAVGAGASPDDTMRTCQMWYQKSGPRLSISLTANITKISNAFVSGLV